MTLVPRNPILVIYKTDGEYKISGKDIILSTDCDLSNYDINIEFYKELWKVYTILLYNYQTHEIHLLMVNITTYNSISDTIYSYHPPTKSGKYCLIIYESTFLQNLSLEAINHILISLLNDPSKIVGETTFIYQGVSTIWKSISKYKNCFDCMTRAQLIAFAELFKIHIPRNSTIEQVKELIHQKKLNDGL